jgi:hypothetical protein
MNNTSFHDLRFPRELVTITRRFGPSNSDIVGFNPTREMDDCQSLSVLCSPVSALWRPTSPSEESYKVGSRFENPTEIFPRKAKAQSELQRLHITMSVMDQRVPVAFLFSAINRVCNIVWIPWRLVCVICSSYSSVVSCFAVPLHFTISDFSSSYYSCE